MSMFDRVIGYESIKKDLLMVCDMVKNREVYDRLGAKMPKGILLSGEPGLGKTTIAKCFISECGLKTYVIRKTRASDDFVGEITENFRLAKENAPAIVFLDDMDKFANEDEIHRDAEEYVAVQAGIDEVKDSEVLVIATVNDIRKLPRSLKRAGRFDRIIEVEAPTAEDAVKIVKFYLSDKKLSEGFNIEDLTKMISYSSCAELETILNEAAISAAFARKTGIEMRDFVDATLRMQYAAPSDYSKGSKEEIRKVALHEAGHVVVCEALKPGSIGLASVRVVENCEQAGFTHRCTSIDGKTDILVSLAGKAAVEMYYADEPADGCRSDLYHAASLIYSALSMDAAGSFSLIDVDQFNKSENYRAKHETVIGAEMERYMRETRAILLKNRSFLEKVTEALIEKETLLYSDIQRIRKEVA
ncbi:MAG: AAA family ATPase [Lachnospiraceae bacterium]|nr:AAA family ATPase [Lachnospiraceae bacterium]